MLARSTFDVRICGIDENQRESGWVDDADLVDCSLFWGNSSAGGVYGGRPSMVGRVGSF